MKKIIFYISKMDCLLEEQMIRMKLEFYKEVKQFFFDIFNCKLEVYYMEEVDKIYQAICEFKFNDYLESMEDEVELLLVIDDF